MIYAVFLCDKQWKIKKVRQCCPQLVLEEGEVLTDLISEEGELAQEEEETEQSTLELTFIKQNITVPAILQFYKEATLVVLASVENNKEFLEFNKEYPTYQEWAKDRIFGLFHNEYYMIQQMNNQLVDAKRRLTRSNKRLESALKENKEINKQLEEARTLAEKASLSKSRFLANMSHDIRTPMNAIVGLAELMQYHIENPEILKTYLTKLQSSSQYLLDLINDILDLSKIENGSLELRPEPMNIREQIEQIITIIQSRINEKKQNFSVQCDYGNLDMISGDAVRFRQILMNLFSNAVKYTPEGGCIRFKLRELKRNDREKTYEFIVEDDGIGMTPEFVEHIFDPFTRAEAEVKGIQGTGLGMAITKSLIDAMGGTIRVISTQGKGSQFCVEIPFEICMDENNMELGDVQSDIAKDKPITLDGMRFLCAEDNELNAEILISMMELEGAECTVYENGKILADAFENIKAGQYDAILMDVQMPVMNGYEATKAIRSSKNPLGKEIPIIAMTANAFSEDVQRCLDCGMNAHIAKPIDFGKLKDVLRNLK